MNRMPQPSHTRTTSSPLAERKSITLPAQSWPMASQRAFQSGGPLRVIHRHFAIILSIPNPGSSQKSMTNRPVPFATFGLAIIAIRNGSGY